MNKRKCFEVILCWTILTIYQRSVEAGPTNRLRRIVREVYPEIEPESDGNQALVCIVGDVVYEADEPVSSEQPCLKCKCQPPGVQCETIRCMKKPGCKAIHKPNKCCPDYQCECEHNGNIYTNGERLETLPGGECKVCYCRGGEVKCAEVSCYRRSDCEGKTVPGQCCPKYDHCPPRDPQVGSRQDNPEFVEAWSVPSSPGNISTFRNDDFNNQNENRILDSTLDSEPATTPKKLDKATLTEDLFPAQKETPKITIQEIIPEVREIPITEPPTVPKPEIGGILVIEEAKVSTVADTSDVNDLVTDSDADSSEISEVIQQPPPVLRIGDKLVYLKKEGTSGEVDSDNSGSVITVVGAEGLQRGGFEDSGEVHEVQINNDSIQVTSDVNTISTLLENSSSSDEDLELKESGSTHILSLVKRRRKDETTTEISPAASSEQTTVKYLSSTEQLVSNTDQTLTASGEGSVETSTENLSSNSTSGTSNEETPVTETTLKEDNVSSSETSLASQTTEKITIEIIQEQNPAYPPIPEIMSPLHIDETPDRFENEPFDNPSENDTADSEMEMRILPEILDVRSNKTITPNVTNVDWLKNEDISGTLLNPAATLPQYLLKQPVASDFEDASETTTATTTIYETTPKIDEESPAIKTSTVESDVTTTTEGNSNQTSSLENENESKSINMSVEIIGSMETLEDQNEDSGEKTTPKTMHASLMSTEEVDIDSRENVTAEVADMVPLNGTDDDKIESTTKKVQHDVEMIDHLYNPNSKVKNNIANPKLKDVEVISVEDMSTKMDKNVATTSELPEKLPKPEKVIAGPTKSLEKRENSPDDEADIIFKELEDELNVENLQRIQSKEEEEEEAQKVFKELLEETSSPESVTKSSATGRDAELVQKVTDALTRLTLREKNKLDTNLLSVLSNFFTNQQRSYDNVGQ